MGSGCSKQKANKVAEAQPQPRRKASVQKKGNDDLAPATSETEPAAEPAAEGEAAAAEAETEPPAAAEGEAAAAAEAEAEPAAAAAVEAPPQPPRRKAPVHRHVRALKKTADPELRAILD